MSALKMHADEVDIDESLVRRLLVEQFPRWSDLPIRRVESSGTDNAIFRLGNDLAVRLPRVQWAASQVHKETEWLPRLAPYLPLTLPVPLAKGVPGSRYPWHWSACPWIEGDEAGDGTIADLRQAATDLARFIAALRSIDAEGGPAPGEHNFGRGEALAIRDRRTREAIKALRGTIDTDTVTAAWDAAVHEPAWEGPGVWIHGDLAAANLLVRGGKLCAVIDFGGLGVGDPACDLMIAWTLFKGKSRAAFREAADVDDASWARGRGWALSCALIYIPYYLQSNPAGVANARRALDEVLADRT